MTEFVAYCPVDCDGETHRLGLTSKGVLVPIDHAGSERSWKAMEELGGKMPQCMQYRKSLFSLYGRIDRHVPPEFVESAKIMQAKRDDRVLTKMDDLLTHFHKHQTTILDRWLPRFRLALVRSLRYCRYNWPWKPGECTVMIDELYKTRPSGPMRAMDGVYVEKCLNHGELELRFRLPTHWYRCIFMKGLATINGSLVIETDIYRNSFDLTQVRIMTQPSATTFSTAIVYWDSQIFAENNRPHDGFKPNSYFLH